MQLSLNLSPMGAIARWEKFRFNPPPSPQQLEALAAVIGVGGDRLVQMLPPAGVGMKMEPIRLCGAYYAQSPCHKIEWQFKTATGCDRHSLYHFCKDVIEIKTVKSKTIR
ncbi:hypothetical protein QUB05_08110 [Microcoleus sp. F10-C6]|uniref:hypothetical protein n=1 Tax=unclassified Microcoleus TaxID=2642155 RepID=UPI002FD5C822